MTDSDTVSDGEAVNEAEFDEVIVAAIELDAETVGVTVWDTLAAAEHVLEWLCDVDVDTENDIDGVRVDVTEAVGEAVSVADAVEDSDAVNVDEAVKLGDAVVEACDLWPDSSSNISSRGQRRQRREKEGLP